MSGTEGSRQEIDLPVFPHTMQLIKVAEDSSPPQTIPPAFPPAAEFPVIVQLVKTGHEKVSQKTPPPPK